MKTRKLLLALQKRNNARLTELQGQLERNEVRAEDLEAVQAEVQELADQAQEIADELANLDDDGEGNGEGEGTGSGEGSGEGEEGRDGEEGDSNEEDDEGQRSNVITGEQRSAVMGAISKGLSSVGHKSTKNKAKEIRSAFAKFVVGKITEYEARSLGIVTGNGSVTVPKEIASEVISYAQEENPLRKFGTRHNTKSTQGFPVLVKKATAQGHKQERTKENPMPDTGIEFDEIVLDPTEFDALATITKKLLKRSDVPIEDIVIEELKKAYVEKEAQYFFRGDETGNENPGALAKKAVAFTPDVQPDLTSGQSLYDVLVKFKNSVKSSVRKRSMFMINDAALTLIETMKTDDGFPLFKPFEQASNGFDGKILGFNSVVTEYANKSADDLDTPIIYFGDFKSFHYQDVIGAMEVNRLVELYATSNLVGLQIYNILDGQLIYSPLEPTVYKYEVVGASAPVGG